MRRRLRTLALLAFAAGLAIPSTTYAQQSLNFTFGGFVPKGEDARGRSHGPNDDVLVNNLDFLAFNIQDFNGGSAGIEYIVGVGPWLDAGMGVSYYRRTVPSVYADLVNANGTEIEQNMRLRIAPFAATVRFLPLGRSQGIEPYIGAGVGVFNWRYSEFGQFVDNRDNRIFRDSFVGSGSATGPIILGGLKFPAGPWAFGGEVRYQDAKGDLPASQEFSAPRIDLGGWTYNVVLSVRF